MGLADVIFISLKRRNTLAAVVSQKIAESTAAWQVQASPSMLMDSETDDWVVAAYTPEQQVSVTLEEADREIEKTKRLYWEIDQKMMNFRHPFLELYYEDLIEAWSHWMTIVQLYLGVKPVSVAPATRRQETRPLSQAISNYEELRAQACEGEKWWGYMLEDSYG